MIRSAKIPQLHLLPILNLLCIRISPFHWHLTVCIRIHQHIERAIAGVELWEESYGGGDLAEDGLDFELDLFFGFFGVEGWGFADFVFF